MSRRFLLIAVSLLAAGCTGRPGRQVIPFLTNESDAESVRVFREVFAEFEKAHRELRADLVLGTHTDIGQRIVTAASVGADLGVIQVPPYDVMDFVRAGYLLPLDDIVDASGGSSQLRPATMIRGADNHVYALAYAGGVEGTLWVRSDLLQKAGLKPPSNYSELLAAAKALTRDNDGDGRIDMYGIGLPAGSDDATTNRFGNFLLQNCGQYFDARGELAFDQPEALTAVKRYIELLQYAPPGITGWSWFDGMDAFIAGRVAMHPYGGRLGVNLERAAPQIRANTMVIANPAGDRGKAVRGIWDYFAVSSRSRNPAGAKALLQTFFEERNLTRFDLTVPGHLIPPSDAIARKILDSDNPYVKKYRNDVATLFTVGERIIDPQMQMGAIDPKTCEADPKIRPVPWGGAIFSRKPPIDAEMIQRIVIKKEPVEQAWKWAAGEMQAVARKWKAEHPEWKP